MNFIFLFLKVVDNYTKNVDDRSRKVMRKCTLPSLLRVFSIKLQLTLIDLLLYPRKQNLRSGSRPLADKYPDCDTLHLYKSMAQQFSCYHCYY